MTKLGSLVLPPAAFLVLVLVSWQWGVRSLGVSPNIVPPPTAVVRAFASDWSYLFREAAVTASEAAIGLSAGAIGAIATALLFARSAVARRAGYPYVIAFKAIPLVVLAPLTELWFPGLASKAVLAALICFFPILVAALDDMDRTPPTALALMDSLSASPWQVIAYLKLPRALPAIFSGLKVSSTFAVIGAVVAEFVASERGIGHVINTTHYYLQTDQTFAAVGVAAGLGMLFFLATQGLEVFVAPWARKREQRR